MKINNEKNSSILFNLLTLLSFGLGIFLIIFFKQRKNKDVEQAKTVDDDEKARVKTLSTASNIVGKLNKRQLKILEKISQEKSMNPSEIYDLSPDVSTRTIRRDMDTLTDLGLVTQEGSTKATTYIYIGE